MYSGNRYRSKIAGLLISLCPLLIADNVLAAVSAPTMPIDNYNNSISGGLSVGVVSGRDADFWGWSFFEQDAISFSLAAEYNISQREPSVSIDVLFGWSY